jgi:SlyX protein
MDNGKSVPLNSEKPKTASNRKPMEHRITELEIKLSFAENTIESLNQTIFRHQQQLDRLQIELRALRDELLNSQSQSNNPQRSLRDEIPPHY